MTRPATCSAYSTFTPPSRDWDSPAIKTLEQPLSFVEGDGLTFKCTFKNDGDEWIVFGTGDYGADAWPTASPMPVVAA